MMFDKLKKNIISIVKESLIKLGYDSLPISLNYIQSSLNNIMGCEATDDMLKDFCRECDDLGQITFSHIENGYRFDIPVEGVDYVNSLISDDDFLVQFICTIRRIDCTIDDVIAVFKRYGDDVVVKRVDNDEFDYLIYFETGEPDEFWYCIDTEDLGITYHRFMKQDYIDFDF